MRVSRPTSTDTRRLHLPTRTVGTAVVCLPARTPPAALAAQATATLAARGLATNGVLPHFHTHTRRTGKLVDRWNGLTSGGPINLLDLDSMRTRAAAGAAAEWLLWQQVVAGTRPAQPLWAFADRSAADPHRYPLAKAHADYLSQPRVLAMGAHNAIPGQSWPLPTSALEAFQAGYGTYVNLAWLAAVPGDGLAPHAGGWLTTRSQRLADLLDYLATANTHLARLPRDAHLVAVASPA
ncbi:hypothetical protein GCM10022255_101320 [Dactylosporangium darangshiense]|uniref:Uncharacterized protein n=1 Tax=Dactylosporangium darangshiense TaxID=579108 RepID=A0ABP8DRZ8_9ACTN